MEEYILTEDTRKSFYHILETLFEKNKKLSSRAPDQLQKVWEAILVSFSLNFKFYGPFGVHSLRPGVSKWGPRPIFTVYMVLFGIHVVGMESRISDVLVHLFSDLV